jgi:hypothetical protein
MNCYFKLTADQIEFADKTSYGIYIARVADGLVDVGHRQSDDKLWSRIRGGRLECALYLWFGGKQSGARWNCEIYTNWTLEQAKLPDITFRDLSIDAKLQPETGNWAENEEHIVPQRQVNPRHFYIFGTDAEHPLYIFHGWMSGEKVATHAIGGRPEHPGHVIKIAELRDCMSLKDSRYRI